MVERRALITGISGQDGSYLTDLLLEKGYAVAGVVHENDPAAGTVRQEVECISGDLLDADSLAHAVTRFRPTEVYNLAARSSVAASFADPIGTLEVNGLAAVRFIDACRSVDPAIRFFQASSSEIFANDGSTKDERSEIAPSSPYGVAKSLGHLAAGAYRASYSMFICSGIMFNHESPRRGMQFVTRKITDAVAAISLGEADSLSLGNLEVWRDWGFAGDYARAMHLMLQQPEPGDYVIASGECHSLKEFLELAFSHAGLDWQKYVVTDASLMRPSDISKMRGDSSKAQKELGWQPTTTFPELVASMVNADLERRRVS